MRRCAALVLATVLAGQEPASAPTFAQLWDDLQRVSQTICVAPELRPQARRELTRLLTAGGRRILPYVELELGRLDRLEGRLDAAVQHFDTAAAALGPEPEGPGRDAEHPAPRNARAMVLGERGKALLDAGRLDLADRDLRRTERLVATRAPTRPAQRDIELAVMPYVLDGLLARDEPAAVLAKAARGIEQWPDHRRSASIYRVRLLNARLSLAERDRAAMVAGGPRVELAEVARDLRAQLLDPELDPGLVSTVRSLLATACLHLPDAEPEAERLLTGLAADPGLGTQRLAEICAGRARLALRHHTAGSPPGDDLRAAREALAAAWERWRAECVATPMHPGGVGFFHYNAQRAVVGTLVELDLAVLGPGRQGTECALQRVLAAHALGTLARRMATGDVGAGDLVRHLVPAGGGMLIYWFAPFASHVFALDADQLTHHALAGDWGKGLWTGPLRGLLAEPPDPARPEADAALRREFARLAGWLLPDPVRATIASWHTIAVIGGEQVGGVPFECLPWEDSWLGVRKAVHHLPSAAVGVALARRHAGRPAIAPRLDAVLVAATAADRRQQERFGVAPIPFPERAETELLEMFAPTRVARARGAAATTAVLSAHGSETRLLHVLAHGWRDLESERPPCIVLAPGAGDDGLLRSDQVEALHTPPFVILSVCNAALAPLRLGEDGVGHLGGAFLFAGTATIVLSQNEVALRPMLALTRELQAQLCAGERPAEALRRARTALGHLDPAWRHPHYHAGLRVVGLDEPLFARTAPGGSPAAAPVSTAWWNGPALALCAAALVAALWWSRRRAPAQ